MTMSLELVHGDTVTPPAPLRLERLDLDPAQPQEPVLDQPDPALGPAAPPLTALLRDLPVPSPSTSWESFTSAAPQLMETPCLGVPPRLMPTTTMSLELVPGDTVMPLALFKRPLPPQRLHLLLDLLSLLPQEHASAA